MPSSNLWAVDSTGKVFTLTTNGVFWQELPYSGVDLKRVCALKSCAWGIGSDHQVYLYIPSGDVQIRVSEVTYENQRWNPKEGFSTRLLPTDRPAWSSKDGLSARPKQSINLPSSSWQWEGCWYIDDNLDGIPLGPQGWTYCVDFPFTYTPEKRWNSMVRRRKWIRHRRYVAVDKWTRIPGIHGDPVVEPFVDVVAGGDSVPGGEPDSYAVWAVTILGRVAFRSGVTRLNPEGDGWVVVSLPENSEVSQISVGPSGLTWAVAWSGNALVRVGVSREDYVGTGWTEVPAPEGDHKLAQVAVGPSTVWAKSRDGTVWFRKGIHGEDLGCQESITGSGWVEMVGKMAVISVGPNDQVWGARTADHRICLRTGVTLHEASGREWKEITVPIGKPVSRTSSSSSLTSLGSVLPPTPKSAVTDLGGSEPVFSFCGSKGVVSGSPQHSPGSPRLKAVENIGDGATSSDPSSGPHDVPRSPNFLKRPTKPKQSGDDNDSDDMSFVPWSCTCDGSSIFWTWLSGSACTIDYLAAPASWFSTGHSSSRGTQLNAPWRIAVLCRLKQTRSKETKDFLYKDAIEKQSTWVKSANPLLWRDTHPQQWVHCKLELERQSLEVEGVESVMLGLEYTHGGHHKRVNINVAEVTCVSNLSTRDHRILGVYTEELNRKKTYVKIAFASDAELEEWMATLNMAVSDLHGVSGRPNPTAVWAIARCGDAYVQSVHGSALEQLRINDGFWHYLGGGHFRVVESCPQGVTWAIGHNNTPWVYTGGYGGGAYKGISGQNVNVHPMTDTKCVYIYENQRWNPFSGFAARGLLTDRPMWSDAAGLVECNKDSMRPDSVHWQWLTDWAVDYKTPGGVDSDGWQYAMDFPFTYHAHKGLTDYVRRRRWFRLCKLHTSGPWLEVEPVSLKSVSLQMNYDCNSASSIALWAVAGNGEVLYRKGVAQGCPQGECWHHVSAEQAFESISVGVGSSLWALGNDGSGYVRIGISSERPTGTTWFHVEPPSGSCLAQVSMGKSVVCAVDTARRLWYRAEVLPIFPEGTAWILVSEDVCCVSVGPNDQIWAIIDVVQHKKKVLSNVLARRGGISEAHPYGTDWDTGFGADWSHVSIRGCPYREDAL
ncbi:tectonin beta-propeller repeat-containing protein 1-like [Ornithodoros turicata]|uniref:tectonin beta-propeller repeat-containing protein 1-like n=1 Tax=Ornithodoros turicata TaxID=34597 RepID=UPI0031388E07